MVIETWHSAFSVWFPSAQWKRPIQLLNSTKRLWASTALHFAAPPCVEKKRTQTIRYPAVIPYWQTFILIRTRIMSRIVNLFIFNAFSPTMRADDDKKKRVAVSNHILAHFYLVVFANHLAIDARHFTMQHTASGGKNVWNDAIVGYLYGPLCTSSTIIIFPVHTHSPYFFGAFLSMVDFYQFCW